MSHVDVFVMTAIIDPFVPETRSQKMRTSDPFSAVARLSEWQRSEDIGRDIRLHALVVGIC
jgi:hypothetical protein